MRRIPSFPALRAFEAAARLGSFTRACEELHLTPSAISHQVRALERHFGRTLFLRGSGPTQLTPDGARLLKGLSGAFDALALACAELSPAPHAPALSVHCSPSFAACWLGPRLPHFMERHPGLGIRLSSGAEGFDLMRHPETDVAIAYGVAPTHPGLTAEGLGVEEITALCAPEIAAGGRDPSALVLLDSSFSPVRWADWFAANGLPPPPAAPGPSFDRGALVISAAVQGLGVALETLRFARPELDAGRLVRLGEGRFHGIRREMHFLCCRTAQRAEPRIRTFRAWMLERCTSS